MQQSIRISRVVMVSLVRRLAIICTLVSFCAGPSWASFPGGSSGFIENRGQFTDGVDFVGFSGTIRWHLTSEGVIVVRTMAPAAGGGADTVEVAEARPGSQPVGYDDRGSRFNFFLGNDPTRCVSDARAYGRVVYRNALPDGDLEYRLEGNDLIITAMLRGKGAPQTLDLRHRSLSERPADGGMHHGPVEEGSRTLPRAAQGECVILWDPDHLVARVRPLAAPAAEKSARTSARERHAEITLDWARIIGGASNDGTARIGTDDEGNPVICGGTNSAGFPFTSGSYDTSYAGQEDGYVATLSRESGALLWCTFLGGAGYDNALAVNVTAGGTIVVAGLTASTDFPMAGTPYQDENAGEQDFFLAGLSADGSVLVWSTYLGGTLGEASIYLTLDASGRPAITGHTDSADYPTTPGAPYPDMTGGGMYDCCVSRLSADGSDLLGSTYFGGTEDVEYGLGLKFAGDGGLIVQGGTYSDNFPATAGAYDTSWNGGSCDVFVARFDADLTEVLWATLLGGASNDYAGGLDLDPLGNPMVAGHTASGDFPTTPGSFDVSPNGSYDNFVAKLSSEGDQLLWSTFIGGGQEDYSVAIMLDAEGCPVVFGYSLSPLFPATPDAYDSTHNGNWDPVLYRLSASGDALLYSSFFGGSAADYAGGGHIDPFGAYLMVGPTNSTDFPVTHGEQSYGGTEGFILRMDVQCVITVEAGGGGEAPTIQAAIDMATAGCEIVLEDGVYLGPGNRDLDFQGKQVALRSISGDPAACVIDCEHAGRGLLFASGEGPLTSVSGIMIINGQADRGGAILCDGSSPNIENCVLLGNAATPGGGGGMHCAGSSDPGLTGCVMAWNTAASGGGGLDCEGTSGPELLHCVIDHNTSTGAGACIATRDQAHPTLDHTILSFGWGGEAFTCDFSFEETVTCCNVYGNELGDYTGCLSGLEGTDGNFSADPFFCGEANPLAYYAVAEDSPCAPENNPGCGLVGVAGIGCAMREVVPGGGGEYETIQAAVDAAVDGDIVLLEGGIFEGQGNRGVSMYGRAIIIRTLSRGRSGAAIDCGGVTRGFIFESSEGSGSVLEGVTIINGLADNGGAVFCSTGTSPRLIDCTFASNSARLRGGGLCCWEGASPEVIRCTFEADTAESGGAVSCLDGAAPVFEDCRFEANIAHAGGAIHCEPNAAPSVSRATILGNRATASGGALHCAAGAAPHLLRCTLVDNGAAEGGGVYSLSGQAQLAASIIAFGSGGGAFGGTGASFSCSDLHGNTGGDWTGAIAAQVGTAGNFSLDPLFCDLPGGDLRLWNSSPCIQVACGLIGAWPMGLTNPQGVDPTAEQADSPTDVCLAVVAPNPAAGTTSIAYRFGGTSRAVAVRLVIYDVGGRLVRELVDDVLPSGSYETQWNGRDQGGCPAASGIYLCRLEVGGQRRVERMLRVR